MIIDAQGLSNTTIKNTSFSPHMLRIFDIIHWRHNNNVDIMIYYYSKETIRVSDEKGKKRKEKEKKNGICITIWPLCKINMGHTLIIV